MYIEIDNKNYIVNIEYKANKNMYLRVKKNLTILITAPKRIREKDIIIFINNNKNYIAKQIRKFEKKEAFNDKFKFLGNYYDVVYLNSKSVEFIDDRVFIDKNIDIDKFYRKQAELVFKERLDVIYLMFNNIPYPKLKIRKMTTRWGVCNCKLSVVTLNLELIKYSYNCIDYVIIHELSHFIEQNHSSKFWDIVEQHMPDYKKYRKELKD